MTCEICPIITSPSQDEQDAHLYEGAYWRATLRVSDQRLIGTSFITAKRHIETLSELQSPEQIEFFDVHTILEIALRQAFGAQVINTSCLMNLAYREPQSKPHVHWHLKPRYAEPVIFQGVTFTDPAFGSYLDGTHERQPVSMEQAREIIEAIQRQFKR
jgi:diadenosine tetraphosphate (Ap4A) HIT family hydrolase